VVKLTLIWAGGEIGKLFKIIEKLLIIRAYTTRMPYLRIFKPKPFFLQRFLLIQRIPRRAASILLLAWVLPCAVLAILPRLWVEQRTRIARSNFNLMAHQAGHRIVDCWGQPVLMPPFQAGDEPPVADLLRREPLLLAWVDPERQKVWIRDGDDRLVPAQTLDRETFLAWANVATIRGANQWVPTHGMDFRSMESSSLLVKGEHGWAVKRWTPGHSGVDRFLQRCLGPNPPLRFGLFHFGGGGSAAPRPQSSPMPGHPPGLPHFQIGDESHDAEFPCMTRLFGNVWGVAVAMSSDEAIRLRTRIGQWKIMAWTVYGIGFFMSGLAVLTWMQIQHFERLVSHRLASLTHSLKTPLSVLKLRCDTARNGNLPRERQDAYLAHIGDEVDHLVQYIESGLEWIRPRRNRPALDLIDEPFFQRLDDDFRTIFVEAGRVLDFRVTTAPFRADAQALHAALATLLENGLVHGKGDVRLKADRRRNLVTLAVTDQGAGWDFSELGPEAGGEGPTRKGGLDPVPRKGKGLGLRFLFNLAGREGWGLTFRAEPGEGFASILEIRQ